MGCVAEGAENDAIADMLASIGGLSFYRYPTRRFSRIFLDRVHSPGSSA